MNEQCFYRISVKGIVIDEQGRVLLTREDNGKWELLGGGLDHDEAPHDGLRREIMEETGLTVTWIAERPSYFLTVKRHNQDSFMANIIYEMKLENLDFTPSDECEELRFFSLVDMHEVELFPNVAKLLTLLESAA